MALHFASRYFKIQGALIDGRCLFVDLSLSPIRHKYVFDACDHPLFSSLDKPLIFVAFVCEIFDIRDTP